MTASVRACGMAMVGIVDLHLVVLGHGEACFAGPRRWLRSIFQGQRGKSE